MIETIEAEATDERNTRLQEQIAYLETAITEKGDDDERLFRAYMAKVFDEEEYAEKRRMVTSEREKMHEERDRLKGLVITPEQVEARTRELLAFAEEIRAAALPIDPPFALKQKIIKMLVNEIVLHVRDGWFALEGALSGVYPLTPPETPGKLPIVSTRIGTDSSPPSAENWPGKSGCRWPG